MMTRDEAIELCGNIPTDGTFPLREWYCKHFGVGTEAARLMSAMDDKFLFGIEYGVLIGLSKAFNLTPDDYGCPPEERETERWKSGV